MIDSTLQPLTRRQVLVGAAGVAAATALGSTAAAATPAPGRRRGVQHRGVVYGVVDGSFPETSWSPHRMRDDVRTIAQDLHANSIVIEGDGPERMLATAAEAATRGLSVWLRPTLGDVPGSRILDHLAEVGRGAERLRCSGADVVLCVGCEFVLYVPGIVPGKDALERIANLLAGHFDPVDMQRKLDSFIGKAAAVGRRVFHGPLTYSAAEGDVVDWKLLDIVGIDYYSYFADPAGYRRDLAQYLRFGKPLAITEFGTCTYRGAADTGGLGFDVVDYSVDPPRVADGLVRSESAQARQLTSLLDVFDDLGLFAAMVFTFGDAEAPHRSAPRYDLDMASYGLMAPIWDTFDRPGRGWHWQRKEAFDAVARAYGRPRPV